jgi:hypothetical protein
MDTSFWTQRNPNIGIEHTTKKFYGKYLYKLVVYCPAGRLISSSGELADELQYRKEFNYNHGGSWYRRTQSTTLSSARIDLLESLRTLKTLNLPDLKIRVEEPRIQLYSTNIQQLENIISNYLSVAPTSYIETISGPADDDAETILNSGAIIRKNDTGYRYKILLKDGFYSLESKRNMLDYLQNIGPEQVRVPRGTYFMLNSNSQYIYGCYLYANDLNITTFLQIINPGIVTNSHELVVIPHK